jgi:hypothetical protein
MSTDLASNVANTAGDWYPTTYDWLRPWPTVQPTYVYPLVWNPVTVQTPRCAWCQGQHIDKCPDLKSVTYRPDGTVEQVEFFGEREGR